MQVTEVKKYLLANYTFRYNKISRELMFVPNKRGRSLRRLDEISFNDIWLELEEKELSVSAKVLRRLLHSSMSPHFNPFDEYFEQLPPWIPSQDIDHISELASTVQSSRQEKFAIHFRKWIVAMVACATEPSITNHTALVLSGPQGIGKTRFLESLLPDPLAEYSYCGILPSNSREVDFMLTENILLNLDELAAISRSQLERIKLWMTKSNIRQRRPYATVAENFPRRASFAATVNGAQFLQDQTGNRRFLAFEVEQFNFKHGINMDLVYSQALTLFLTGFRFWFNREEIRDLEEINAQFEQTTIEEHILLDHFTPGNKASHTFCYQASELLFHFVAKGKLKQSNSSLRALGIALNKHGFARVKHKGRYRYYLKKV